MKAYLITGSFYQIHALHQWLPNEIGAQYSLQGSEAFSVKTTYSNAAIILVILQSFSEFEELPTAVYHSYAEIVRKLFVLEYLEFLS